MMTKKQLKLFQEACNSFGKCKVGVTAGASAPEILVQEVVDRIQSLAGAEVHQLPGVEEGVSFPLPKELQAS